MNEIIELFQKITAESVQKMELLPISGSNRKYYRIQGEKTCLIATAGSSREENRAFCYMSGHFLEKGLHVPKVLAHNEDYSVYIQEDLGSLSLFDAIAEGRKSGTYNQREKEILLRTVRELPRFQFEGADGFDYSQCYPHPEFDRRSIAFDLNYFKYCFLKPCGLDFNESLLEDDFERLTDDLLKVDSHSFLYRDFQARNVMLKDGIPYFIDFQGGRKGPFYYDLASFVWQARSRYPAELKEEMMNTYKSVLRNYIDVDDRVFDQTMTIFVLFRTLQVMGAYGFRGYFERKPHFIESVPYALENLREILQKPLEKYLYLSDLLKNVVKLRSTTERTVPEGLHVRIFSFAYKYGIPEDVSGNGGGYVFDCRGMHNPGRYEEYRKLTGTDPKVIAFLEQKGEVQQFMSEVCALADAHIETYLRRGFRDLMFSFGCTGGQHRSVYCAEYLARYLSENYPVTVTLIHREQGVNKEFKN